MSANLENLIEKRRSIYNLGKQEILAKDKIVELVENSAKHCPTAFNSQTARAVVLFGKNHDRLWEIVLETLKPLTPPEKFSATAEKINSFKRGYGTILLFEDQEVVESLQKKFQLYAENFPKWSQQSHGIFVYMLWLGLTKANVGANLQHYNPIIDEKVAKEWKIPSNWKLLGQMPFGSIEKPAENKIFEPIEPRIKVFK